MSALAAMRPDDVNVALLVHVAGAMILVGGLVTAGTALAVGWRDTGVTTLRLGYRTLLAVALPGYVLMRIGAHWTESEENLPEDVEESAWLGIGYVTADAGALLLVLALILGGIGIRRLRTGGGSGLLKATTVITLLLVAAYVVAVWAMAGKPD